MHRFPTTDRPPLQLVLSCLHCCFMPQSAPHNVGNIGYTLLEDMSRISQRMLLNYAAACPREELTPVLHHLACYPATAWPVRLRTAVASSFGYVSRSGHSCSGPDTDIAGGTILGGTSVSATVPSRRPPDAEPIGVVRQADLNSYTAY